MANGVGEWLDEVATRLRAEIDGGAAPKGEEITVRELLNRFGYARRGIVVVAVIRGALEERQLRTVPDFEFEWIDNPISIVQTVEAKGARDKTPVDPTIRVGILPAAHNAPVSVKRDDTLAKATTIMQIEDYSQLPVMPNERTVKGIVSWASIGAAHAQGKKPTRVRECMVEAQMIDVQMPLADATDMIQMHDYVLVRGKDRRITGIVTAVDLAHEFKQLTQPFLMIGEIEHHVRNLIRGKFSIEEFVEAALGDETVRGPHDLTFGGYCRLLQSKEAWARLGLNIDHSEFKSRLESLRKIRNDVMHFSPEPRDPSEIRQLECMARFCRTLTTYDSD